MQNIQLLITFLYRSYYEGQNSTGEEFYTSIVSDMGHYC